MERFSKPYSHILKRHAWFPLFWILSLALCWTAVSALVRLSLNDFRYSHLIIIPFISAYLVYWRRETIFGGERWSPRWGALLLAAGVALYIAARWLYPIEGAGLSLAVFSLVVVWMGGFLFCYGPQSFKAALFPLLFLLLTVPVPGGWLDRFIALLQQGSTEATALLFSLIGESVYREGYTFWLPGVSIEVARECSSIRSGTALLITGLLTSYAFIRSPWRRAFLVALTIPIAMFTNAIRIVILSWLTVHVDKGYLYGNLHHSGGAVFSLISVAVLVFALRMLSEDKLGWRRNPIRG